MQRKYWVVVTVMATLLLVYVARRQMGDSVNTAPTATTAVAPMIENIPSGQSQVTPPSESTPPAAGVEAGSAPSTETSQSQPNPAATAAQTSTPALTANSKPTDPPTPVSPSAKVKPNFPGIQQVEDAIMVSAVRHKPGDGEDIITVSLARIDGQGEVDGLLWVIGEYIQRGTTGVMFMASHNELKVAADGQPKFPRHGVKFQMRLAVEKNLVLKRPGFEGEELIGVRVGVVDQSSGKVHMAVVSMKQLQKKTAVKRAKIAD